MILRKFFFVDERVCPWWLAPTFDNPLRPLIQNAYKILEGLVRRGDTVADIGCGMGYFTIPMARIVGPQGQVLAIDLQEKMLQGVRRRALKAGILKRISLQQAQSTNLGLGEHLDFALAFWMVHEVPDQPAFLDEVRSALKPGAKLLVVEPLIHVSAAAFQSTLEVAEALGFKFEEHRKVNLSRAMLLRAPETE